MAVEEKTEGFPVASAEGQNVDDVHGGHIDKAVEKRMLRKFDTAVLGCFGILYFMSDLDRTNLGNAESMGLPEDLHLTGNQFGNAVSIFYATHVVFETPFSVLLKIVGPRRLLSTCMLLWGIVGLCTAFVKTIDQLYACRLLLGLFESGLVPCIDAYLGMVYLRSEMSTRVAVYYTFRAVASAFGGLLATAASYMHRGALHSWSYLFLIEGCITVALVPAVYWVFPVDPLRAWFLSDDEKAAMRRRFERNPHLDIEDKFRWADVLSAWRDLKVWAIAALEFFIDFSLFGFTNFLPSLLKGMGFEGYKAQLMTVPVYACAAIAFFLIAAVADRIGMRGPPLLFALLCAVLGYAIMLGTENTTARFVSVFILSIGVFTTTGLNIVWLNANVSGCFKRATAVGTVLAVADIAGTAAGQLYRAQDRPRYLPAVDVSLGITCLAIAIVCLLEAGYYLVNQKRARTMAEMGGEEAVTDEMWRHGQKDDYSLYFKYTL